MITKLFALRKKIRINTHFLPSRASDELAAFLQVRKKKSCAESKKESYPPKISWGIRFWGFRGPTTSRLKTHPKKLPKMAIFGCF